MIKIIVFILLSNYIAAQESNKYTPDIIPPAPSVNNLMKFEEVPVSHYTGVPDISIPLAAMNTGLNNVNISLSLKYHSLSVKPEDRAGEAGIGWNLFAGGTISRTIVDLPDDIETVTTTGTGSNPAVHKFGIYLDETTGNLPAANRNYTKKFTEVLESGNPLLYDNQNYRKLLYEAYFHNRFDTSYDLYQYNFMNYTGRFIVKKNSSNVLEAVKLERNNLRIVCKPDVNNPNTIISFDITDEYGNTFTFDVKELSNTSAFSHSANIFEGDNINYSTNNQYTSSYHLTKIKDPSNIEVVKFNYYPKREISINNVSEINRSYTGSFNFPNGIRPFANTSLPKKREIINSTITTETRQLQEIIIKDRGKFYFEYEYGRQDDNYDGSLLGNLPRLQKIKMFDAFNHLTESNVFYHNYSNGYNGGRLTLNSVKKYDKNDQFISEYNLNYNAYLPQMAEDEWKYLKCKDFDYSYRDDCISAGQLKSITLPTKGKIEFDYEANSYSYHPNSEVGSPETVEVSNYDDNELNWDRLTSNVNFTNFTSGYKYAFTIVDPVKASLNFNFDALYQSNYSWYLTLVKKEGNNYTTVAGTGPGLNNDANAYSTGLETNLLSAGEYYLKLDNYMGSNAGTFNVWVNSFYKIKNQNNYRFLPGGGIRIKRVKYYDSPDGNTFLPAKMTDYSYNSLESDKKSSGALVFPKPMYQYDEAYNYKFIYIDGNYQSSYSGSYNHLIQSKDNFLAVQKTKGGDIGYQYVIQKETGKGKTVYKFTSPIDYPNLGLPTFRPVFLPTDNYDFRRGNILNKKVYAEGSTNPLTEEKFQYSELLTQTIPLGIGLRFDGTAHFNEFYYGSVFKTYEEYQNAYDNENIVVDGQLMMNHPYRTYCLELTRDSYNFVKSFMKKEIVGKMNLVKQESIQYFDNQQPVKETTNFEYNSRDYPTKKATELPDGTVQETTYQYAHEKGNTKLINANMIATPLETTVVLKKNISDPGKAISKIENLYDDPLNKFPSSIKTFDFQNISSTEITFDQYDNKGNLLQYTTKDGISTAIIWGYNSTQPIAKIVGATYAQVSSLAADIISASDSDTNATTEQDLIDKLDIFRKQSTLSSAQITTYTYDPLIGVKSITSPSGIREVYLYDTANRLKEIRENNALGKVLKEFKYNYKH